MTHAEILKPALLALGIGLLIGTERERRKAERPATAGLRSFTIAALLGCAAARGWITPSWVLAKRRFASKTSTRLA